MKLIESSESGATVEAARRIDLLVRDHRRPVFVYALRLTGGDVGWAEDVVQETFVRAWRHWAKLSPEQGSVRGWLMRVAHNLVMDEYRSPRRRRAVVTPDAGADIAVPESTDQVLSAQVVRDALRSLPDPHRKALEATYLRDHTASQAALELDVPVGTVKSRVFYGLRMLRSTIGGPQAVEC